MNQDVEQKRAEMARLKEDAAALFESTIRSNLELSYEERIEAHEHALALMIDLRNAGEEYRAKSKGTA